MPSITVRDLPQDVLDELAARAARSGRTLQEYLRAEFIQLAGKPQVGVVLARARRRAAATSTVLSAETILKHRDTGRS